MLETSLFNSSLSSIEWTATPPLFVNYCPIEHETLRLAHDTISYFFGKEYYPTHSSNECSILPGILQLIAPRQRLKLSQSTHYVLCTIYYTKSARAICLKASGKWISQSSYSTRRQPAIRARQESLWVITLMHQRVSVYRYFPNF